MGHADEVEELRRSVLESRARTDPALRAAAFSGEHVPEPWTAYVTKVRNQSYRVTDEDIARLTAGGVNEDWIFEVTVAAALGAAALGLQAGLAALSEAD